MENSNYIVSIYPNPADNKLTINSAEKIKSVIITNSEGQQIYSNDFSAKNVTISIQDIPPGIYFIKINNEYIRRFVKQ